VDLRHLITCDYQEAVSLLPGVPTELRKALKTHQRVPVFIDNLTKQIAALPKHLRPDRLKLKRVVYDMTNLFVMNVKRQAEERHMSDLAKKVALDAAQRAADLAEASKGNFQGHYGELSEGLDTEAGVKNGSEDKLASPAESTGQT
jgi:hypothetical protein